MNNQSTIIVGKFELTTETIVEMRNWVADCRWGEDYDDREIAEMPLSMLVRGIERHYSGGVNQFVSDVG